jgi:hypothetical protein
VARPAAEVPGPGRQVHPEEPPAAGPPLHGKAAPPLRPPQLEGRRSGRLKGSRSFARAWRDARWGYQHRHDDRAAPPTAGAGLWRHFASWFPDEVGAWLEDQGMLGEESGSQGPEGPRAGPTPEGAITRLGLGSPGRPCPALPPPWPGAASPR